MHFRCDQESIEALAQHTDLLAMGIKPSGDHLHEGHQVTMFGALEGVAKSKKSRLAIAIDDRQFEGKKRPVLASEERLSSLRDSVNAFVRGASQYFHSSSLPERVDVFTVSKFLRESGLHSESVAGDFVQMLSSHWGKIRAQFQDTFTQDTGRVCDGVRPLCPHCDHGESIARSTVVRDGEFQDTCTHPSCDGMPYTVNAAQEGERISIYYVLAGLRDVLLAERAGHKSVLHVYGGDYASTDYGSGISKADRMSAVGSHLKKPYGVNVDFYSGPILCRKQNGKLNKLAKSSGDRCDTPDFERLASIVSKRQKIVEM